MPEEALQKVGCEVMSRWPRETREESRWRWVLVFRGLVYGVDGDQLRFVFCLRVTRTYRVECECIYGLDCFLLLSSLTGWLARRALDLPINRESHSRVASWLVGGGRPQLIIAILGSSLCLLCTRADDLAVAFPSFLAHVLLLCLFNVSGWCMWWMVNQLNGCLFTTWFHSLTHSSSSSSSGGGWCCCYYSYQISRTSDEYFNLISKWFSCHSSFHLLDRRNTTF